MNRRLVGIEILRIISMIMIIILHFLNFGGFLSQYKELSLTGISVWFLEILSFVAVNCYVLIGSYLMCDKKFSIKRIIKLWVQVLFYSLAIMIVFKLYGTNFNLIEIIKYCCPILFKVYWFPTLYIALIVFSPFINKFIKTLNESQYKVLLLINVITFSVLPFVIQQVDHLLVGGAYGFVWFINLYLWAGYIKLYFNVDKINKWKYLLSYIIISIITLIIFMLSNKLNIVYFNAGFFVSYHFILVLFAALAIFMFFLSIKNINQIISKIILFLSPLTFGVYLIHEHPLVRPVLWSFVVTQIGSFSIFNTFLVVVTVYLCCSIIELIRFQLFKPINKLINNSKNISKLNDKIMEVLDES